LILTILLKEGQKENGSEGNATPVGSFPRLKFVV